MEMRFGTWQVRSLYRRRLTNVGIRNAIKYRRDLVRVHKVRWDAVDTEPAGIYISLRKGK
jgi:hypothetical protein